jgi:hypothetical protein
MANPLDAFRNLKPWQQGAIAVGSLVTVGVVWYEHKKSAAAAPAATTPADSAGVAGSSAAAGETEDPSTGQYYPDDTVDPETGLTYQQEITEYGSVSAADAAASGAGNQATLQGETPQEYVEQIGGTPTAAGSAVTTNAQWMAEVETGLSEQGYTASDIGQGLAAYFASKPLGTSSDGTNLYTMMNLAVSEYNPPPTGSYPLLIAGSTTTTPPAGGSGATGAPQTAPDPVTTGTQGDTATWDWPAVGGATKYQVDVTGTEGSAKASPVVTQTHAVIVLPPGTYLSKVRAGNSKGWGPYGAPKTVTVTVAAATAKKK